MFASIIFIVLNHIMLNCNTLHYSHHITRYYYSFKWLTHYLLTFHSITLHLKLNCTFYHFAFHMLIFHCSMHNCNTSHHNDAHSIALDFNKIILLFINLQYISLTCIITVHETGKQKNRHLYFFDNLGNYVAIVPKI